MSVITGIVEGGPAYIAGLREGQKIVGMSVTRDEPERLAKFKVRTVEGNQQSLASIRRQTCHRLAIPTGSKPGMQSTALRIAGHHRYALGQ